MQVAPDCCLFRVSDLRKLHGAYPIIYEVKTGFAEQISFSQ